MERLYILFSDIRGHTQWSEKHSTEDLIKLLKNYYSVPTSKYLQMNTCSDEILMFFENIKDAYDAANKIYNYSLKLEKEEKLSIGISLHVGEVENTEFSYGNIHYTTYVGYAVSIGKRLEDLSSGSEIVISDDVFQDLTESKKKEFSSSVVVKVKGKNNKIRIHLKNGNLRI